MMDKLTRMKQASDNRQAVLAVLRSATRRLVGVRALEAAGAGAVAAGLSVAAGQAGLLAARVSTVLAVGVALLPVAASVAILRWPRLRLAARLDRRDGRLVSAIVCGAALACVAVVLAGRAVPHPRLLMPLILVPLGALLAGGTVLFRGISLGQAALYHDVRFDLAERLSTAAELASGQDADRPIARCVFAQAVTAAADADLPRRGLWRRSRATVGALALSVSLCTVLAIVSPPGSAGASAGAFDEIRQRVRQLNTKEKRELIEALRKLADRVERDPALRRRLLAAAKAAEKDQQLDSSLAELQDAVADADDAEAARIARVILKAVGLATESGDGMGGSGEGKIASGQGGKSPPAFDANSLDANSADSEKPLPARTLVYNPSYSPKSDANSPAPSPSAVASSFVSFDDAWSLARVRAAEAMRAGAVAPEYRDLVRRFFEIP